MKENQKKLKKISSSLEQLVSVAMKFNIFQHETACYKCTTPCIMFRLFLVRPMKIQPTQRKIQLLIISFGLHYVVYFGYFVSNLRGFSTFQNRKHQVQEQFSHWKHFPHWRCSWRCTKIASHVHWIYSVWFLRINHQRFNGAYFYSAVCMCALCFCIPNLFSIKEWIFKC